MACTATYATHTATHATHTATHATHTATHTATHDDSRHIDT